jgi:tetratricopeptide (TPR) repeat protein
MVERTGDVKQVARTMNILGRLLTIKGDAARGLPLLSEAAARLDMVGSHNDALISQGMVGAERAFQGHFAEGLKVAQKVYEASLKQADLAAVAAAAVFVEAVHHAWGHWAEAETWARRALDLAQQTANLVYERNVYLFLGLPLAYQGDVAGGRAALERAIALGGECHSRVFMGRAHAWLAETCLLACDLEGARAAAETGCAIAEASDAQFDLALCRRALGLVLTELGEWSLALAALTQALTAFQERGMAPEVGRAQAAMARFSMARGDDKQAGLWIDQATQTFTRLDMAWDLAELERQYHA